MHGEDEVAEAPGKTIQFSLLARNGNLQTLLSYLVWNCAMYRLWDSYSSFFASRFCLLRTLVLKDIMNCIVI